MATETGRTGDAGSTDARRLSGHQVEPHAHPLLGYLCINPATPDAEVERLRRLLANYAQQEGFTLHKIFVDRSLMHTAAFAELLHTLKSGEAAHVVVPSLRHLAHFQGVQLAMKDLLETQTGARVLVLDSSLQELP